MDEEAIDLLIVGGGLIGASLMIILSDLGFNVKLVEAKPFSLRKTAPADTRSLTLSPASAKILQTMSIWPLIEKNITAIKTIHISEEGRIGQSNIRSNDSEALGYVIDIQILAEALYQRMDSMHLLIPSRLVAYDPLTRKATLEQNNTLVQKRVELLVAADGADSCLRQLLGLPAKVFDYGQHALVTNIELARPHAQCAYERFTRSGPMAVLPKQGLRVGLVWAQSPAATAELNSLSNAEFLKTVQRVFGYKLGRFLDLGQRVVYPLRQVFMPQQTTESVVFIGNAAHTLHPIAGQGFNLGLRDVATLAQCIAEEGLTSQSITHYTQARQHDQAIISHFTDKLVKLFSSQRPSLISTRGAGLIVFDNLPPLKKIIGRYTRGFGGSSANLICGIPIVRNQDSR